MTISKKPRGLKCKLDYDDEEEKDMTDEDQQTMEINWTQLTLTKSFEYGTYSAGKVVQ